MEGKILLVFLWSLQVSSPFFSKCTNLKHNFILRHFLGSCHFHRWIQFNNFDCLVNDRKACNYCRLQYHIHIQCRAISNLHQEHDNWLLLYFCKVCILCNCLSGNDSQRRILIKISCRKQHVKCSVFKKSAIWYNLYFSIETLIRLR